MTPANPDPQRSASALPAIDPAAERACKSSTVAWAVREWRGTARSALERLRALQAAGLINDETNPVFHHCAERKPS